MMQKVIVLAMLAAVPAAYAQSDYVYNWTYSSSLYAGAGTLTINPNTPLSGIDGVDTYMPVSITGTFNGQTITGLDLSQTSGFYNYDNNIYFQSAGSYVLTYPAEPLWEVDQLAFLTGSDEYVMNGYPAGDPLSGSFDTYDLNGGGNGGSGDDGGGGNFALVPVPESAVNPGLIAAAGLFLGWRRWRSVRAART